MTCFCSLSEAYSEEVKGVVRTLQLGIHFIWETHFSDYCFAEENCLGEYTERKCSPSDHSH